MSRRPASSKTHKAESNHSGEATTPRYRRQYASTAKAMCEFGATRADLAKEFGVDEATIGHWQVSYSEFFEACRLGTEHADLRVEQSLHQRAVGYQRKAQKVISHKGRGAIVEHQEDVPADVSAAQFWLMNRQPGKWQLPAKLKPASAADDKVAQLAHLLRFPVLQPKED